MNNLSSYYGLTDSRMTASEKYLPVLKQMNDWLPIFRLSYIMHLQNELYFQRIQQEMQRFRNHFELVDEKNTKNVSLHFKIELILFKKNTIQSRL